VKIKTGGGVSYKIMVAQYEPLEVNSYIEIEKEFLEDNAIEEKIIKLNEKINEMNIISINQKMKTAVANYKDNISKLRKLI